jgi:hypothetical protein
MSRENAAMQPLLLIDIDGPLNPFRAPWFGQREAAPGFEFHDLTPAGGITYRVALNQEHGRRLAALSHDAFDLVWATTWLNDANALIAPLLGLPTDLPVIPLDRPNVPRGRRSWKAEQIAYWVGSRPFAWFDDEINRATRSWLESMPNLGAHLAHRVEPHVGLVDADFVVLRSFADSL